METRRNHLKIIGAVGATCAFPFSADELYGQQDHDHMRGDGPNYRVPVVPPFEPKFFSVEEGLVISRMADLIIPPTDTPGAAAAGVPHYIDMVVIQNAEHQKRFRGGIAWVESRAKDLHGKGFIELTEEQQIAILAPLSESSDLGKLDTEGVAFFHAVKNMTADGYYTSYAGLVTELGYKGNQALPSFEGCVHEH
jgi:hypothetical protein